MNVSRTDRSWGNPLSNAYLIGSCQAASPVLDAYTERTLRAERADLGAICIASDDSSAVLGLFWDAARYVAQDARPDSPHLLADLWFGDLEPGGSCRASGVLYVGPASPAEWFGTLGG